MGCGQFFSSIHKLLVGWFFIGVDPTHQFRAEDWNSPWLGLSGLVKYLPASMSESKSNQSGFRRGTQGNHICCVVDVKFLKLHDAYWWLMLIGCYSQLEITSDCWSIIHFRPPTMLFFPVGRIDILIIWLWFYDVLTSWFAMIRMGWKRAGPQSQEGFLEVNILTRLFCGCEQPGHMSQVRTSHCHTAQYPCLCTLRRRLLSAATAARGSPTRVPSPWMLVADELTTDS